MVEQRLVEAGRARDRQRGQGGAIEQGKLKQLFAGQRAGTLFLQSGQQRVEGDPVGLALGAKASGRKGRRRDAGGGTGKGGGRQEKRRVGKRCAVQGEVRGERVKKNK